MTDWLYLERVIAVPRHGWSLILHYDETGRFVKKLYRFRQIQCADFVQYGVITAAQIPPSSGKIASWVVCAFLEA